MKKNNLLVALVVLFISSTQLFAQDRDLPMLLAEYNNLRNSPMPESYVMEQNFNEAEQLSLAEHFSKMRDQLIHKDEDFTRNVNHFFYVQNIRSTGNFPFGTLDGEAPFDTIDVIVEPLADTCFSGDFDDNGILYALTTEPDPISGFPYLKNLVTIDLVTGELTPIGNIVDDMGQVIPTGLSYNFTTSTMYATTSTDLYEVDLTTGSASYVGPLGTTGGVVIWLEIDNNGNAFAADVTDDSFYSVDLTTGSATLIGGLGIDISFAQGASFDPFTNELYMAGYEGGGIGNIYSVDTLTGATTLLGETTSLDAEFAVFSIEGVPFFGLEDNLAELVTLYPNPMGDQLNVKLPAEVDVLKTSLFDVLGRKTDVKLINGSLDVFGLSKGVYLLQLTTNLGLLTYKVVKE